MQPRLLAVVAALLFVSAGILFAAETSKGTESKSPPAVVPQVETVAYLGLSVVPAGAALDHQIGLPHGTGLLVEGVAADSPAAKAGILRYDVLGKIDDQLLIDLHQFRTLVWMHKPGDQIKLSYYRNGKAETAAVTLGSTECKEGKCISERGMGEGFEFGLPWHAWHHDAAELGQKLSQMEQRLQDLVKREVKEAVGTHAVLPAPTKAPEAKPNVTEEKPMVKPPTSLNVNIITDKYAVTVDSKNGQEFATVKTMDGKSICKDLPQAKWSTLPEDVRGILNGVHLSVKGGIEQIKVET